MTSVIDNTQQVLTERINNLLSELRGLQKQEEDIKVRKLDLHNELDALIAEKFIYTDEQGQDYSVSIVRGKPKPTFNIARLAQNAPDLYAKCMSTTTKFDEKLLETEYAKGHISEELLKLIKDGETTRSSYPKFVKLKDKDPESDE